MKYIHFFFCLLLGMAVQAQIKIGDNPQNIDPSSVLELESSSRVLVITRVNTAQMNAIVPSAGALVYNTDVQCIHYYTGTEWKDICDAVAGSITFTSDDGTVVITSTGGNNYDLKVGQITGMNIVNETVFGADIATATIGERQLAPNSVGSSELQDNTVGKDEIQEAAVGTLEIIDGTIKPEDMEPGAFDQLLTTDAAGNVVWLNKNELGATQADQTTITGAGTAANPIKVADTVIGDILANANDISQNSADIAANTAALGTKEDVANKSDDTNLGNSTTLYPTQNAVKTYVDQAAGAVSSLNSANIFVGSAGNVATGVAMSGDATINNTGVVTIANNAITDAKLDKTNIPLSGFGPAAAPVSLGTNRLTNVANPTATDDAATKAYVDAQVGGSDQTIVSADTPNSITAGTDGGALYNDGDDDDTNELQTISLTGNNLILSDGGGSVPLPSGADGVVTGISTTGNNLVVTGSGGGFNGNVNLEPLVDNAVSNNGYLTTEVDGSITNEIITASSLTGTTLTITEGGNDFDIDLTGLGGGSADGVISLVELNGTDLDFTGTGGGFNGTIDLSTIDTTLDESAVDAFVANNGYLITEVDGSVTNETITASSLTGATLTITEGGVDFDIDLTGLGGGSQDLASVLTNGSSAGNSQINDLLDPTLPQDAATQNYVETRIATILASGGVDGVVSNAFLSGTEIDFVGTNGGFNGTVDLDPIFATDAQLATAITASEALDLDKDDTNEIQVLSLTGNDLALSNGGGTVTIPSADGVVSNVAASATGFDVTGANGGFNGSVDLDAVFATDAELSTAISASEALDLDKDQTNEIQVLSLTGNDLALSNGGGTVTIPSADGVVSNVAASATGFDVTGANGGFNGSVDLDAVFATDAQLSAAITASEALDLDMDAGNEIQVLSLTGNDLALSNGGGTVTLTATSDGVVSNVAASATGFDVTGANGGFNGSVDLDAVFATDAQLSAAITASEALDLDMDAGNEIQVLSLTGNDLALSNGGGTVTLTATSDGVVSNVAASATGFDVTGANGGFNGSVDLDAVFATDAQLSAAITASEALDLDMDAGNEIQVLSLTGNDLALSNGGGTVTLTATSDGVVSDVAASATGFDVTGANGGFNGSVDLDAVFATDAQLSAAITASEALDLDMDAGNEIQVLSLTGNDLALSNGGGTVTLTATSDGVVSNVAASATGFDVTGANGGFNGSVDLDAVFATDAQLSAAITASEALDLDMDAGNEIQVLSLTGNDLALSNGGGTVTLTATSDGVVSNVAASATGFDVTGANGGFNGSVDLDAVFATDAQLSAAITASEALDLDMDAGNEIQVLSLTGNDLALSNGGGTVTLTATSDGVVSNVAASATGFDVTGANGGFNGSVDLDAVFATDAQLSAAITASEALDLDMDAGNEIQTISSPDASVTVTPVGNNYELTVAQISGGASGNIAPNSITQGDIANNAIGPGEIDSNAVSSDEIDDDSIMNADINSAAAIAGTKINPNFGGQDVTTTGSYISGTTTYPDYVFQKYFLGRSSLNESYDFTSLKEVEAFVKVNHHLPGIKSASEVETDGHWNLTQGAINNLEKIEELFLHTIEQEKKIDQLKTENESLSAELQSLRKDMDEIKALLQNKN